MFKWTNQNYHNSWVTFLISRIIAIIIRNPIHIIPESKVLGYANWWNPCIAGKDSKQSLKLFDRLKIWIEMVWNVFNEYLIVPSPSMRNVLIRWRKLFAPIVSKSPTWPRGSAPPELKKNILLCEIQLFAHYPSAWSKKVCILFIVSILNTTCLFTVITLFCVTCFGNTFGSSNFQTILDFRLVLLEITDNLFKCICG